MIYVTSDLHGRFDRLKKLLEAADFFEDEENWLYIIGDVIDRNEDGGVAILKWLLMQPNVQLILGNHEQMLLSNRWLFAPVEEENLGSLNTDNLRLLAAWESNGGDCTMDALRAETAETRMDILEYLEECPLVQRVAVSGREYVLVHGGLGNFSKEKRLCDYNETELLWERPSFLTVYDPEAFTVIVGHTPTCIYGREYRNRMIKTEGWWNIDTGAVLDNGSPMLLCLDTLKEYYVEEDGSVTVI